MILKIINYYFAKSISQLIFIMETHCVLFAVESEFV
jgi:hypothetical protein